MYRVFRDRLACPTQGTGRQDTVHQAPRAVSGSDLGEQRDRRQEARHENGSVKRQGTRTRTLRTISRTKTIWAPVAQSNGLGTHS
jgi:hypothetical protein